MKKVVTVITVFFSVVILAGCQNASSESVRNQSIQDSHKAYSDFISGSSSLINSNQSEEWWIPDFSDGELQYEYAYFDLDGYGGDELLVQTVDAPCVYNGVFHFDGENIVCWNSDGAEMNCFDYPLRDGTMVRTYDFNGTRSYTLFNYTSDGVKNDIANLFLREELIPEDSSEKCSYYEVNGAEVEKSAFDEQFNKLIADRLTERSFWTTIN